ncbi:MAG TPA: condensation domain-containing protein [Acidimicrobiales bacterium]|nr:condensation domain-containing protein [Acidimicrobiales bacterium]
MSVPAPGTTAAPPPDTDTEQFTFTVVDEAITHLDTPTEPWSIELEVHLAGRLDEGRLRWALGQAMGHHPMTRARRLPARPADRTYVWEITPVADVNPLQAVDCPDDERLERLRDRLQSLSVPLAESPPFRLRLAHHPDGDVLMLNANHAAFDGFGCVRLLQSLARTYTGEPDPLPDVELSDARDIERHLGTEDEEEKLQRLRAIGEKLRDALRPPARIAPDGGRDESGYLIVHRALSAEGTGRLAEADAPGSVNDLLMAALHLTIDAWNRDHGSSVGRIGVLMPVNLRPKEWREDVITNFVLMARVSTATADRLTPTSTLDAVVEQTENVKRWGTGAALIEVLGRTDRLPLWVKQSLSPLLSLTGNRLVDTALLTNLGQVSDPPVFGSGAGETTGMWFSAPARLPCGLSVGTLTAGGRLHLSFRWRRPLVDRAAAERFADAYLDEVARLTGAEPASLGA